MNIVGLQGNLTRDPELRYTPNGTAICNITVAKSKRYKDAGGEYVEKTGFYNCFCWGPRGEALSNNFSKGKQISIEGELAFEQWETDAGEKRSQVKVQINQWHFCGTKAENEAAPVGGTTGNNSVEPDIKEEEIPF